MSVTQLSIRHMSYAKISLQRHVVKLAISSVYSFFLLSLFYLQPQHGSSSQIKWPNMHDLPHLNVCRSCFFYKTIKKLNAHIVLLFSYQQNHFMCLNSSKCMTQIVSVLREIGVENNVAFKCASWKKEASVDTLHTSAYNITVQSL